jgi:hypothetical protein
VFLWPFGTHLLIDQTCSTRSLWGKCYPRHSVMLAVETYEIRKRLVTLSLEKRRHTLRIHFAKICKICALFYHFYRLSYYYYYYIFIAYDLWDIFSHSATAPSGPGPPHYRGFTITLRHTTLGRTPLDEWSVCRRHFYLTTHNTHERQTSMPKVGFELTIPASERRQTHILDRAATGIGL